MSGSAIDIEQLSAEERLKRIEELWESLGETPEAVRLTDAQRSELGRRLDELGRGQVQTIPWDEVKRQLRDGSE